MKNLPETKKLGLFLKIAKSLEPLYLNGKSNFIIYAHEEFNQLEYLATNKIYMEEREVTRHALNSLYP